jgi:hypothetical protein
MDHDVGVAVLTYVLLAGLRYDATVEAILQKCMSLGYQTNLKIVRRQDNWISLYLLHRNS